MGKCRGDWAIAAAAAVSAAHCLVTGEAIDLSVQQTLSCTYQGGVDGCKGAWTTIDGMQWLIRQSTSLCMKSAIPYTSGKTGTARYCSDNTKCAGSISLQVGAVEVTSGEASLGLQLQTQPVTSYVMVDNDQWRLYAGGIVSYCTLMADSVYQAVLVVGYGTEDFGYGTHPVNFFKVRSSWGTQWGERGDIRLQRGLIINRGICDVARYVTYPTLLSPQAAVDGQTT
ncbi:hypothetical protein SDRG_12754 [Saprolegnia diclina VS20]|uniref:Peptidase C1A papain C-terminal domain-containing protein n=1 Tax=Saprolegnia diclina (strain VS20) TaxID=1156394 RepID=T0Q4J8_SAPDV|nr:hypothetical protein SDRG_12754 [Saprolegnia diclina VS20]EQC29506.1 hypothetical protein SDRG_12754 [Saprolegnia diclina VS20]|eukprot:XP_008617058.1 hypothetical protein SDRG_12754 [Saprolegnia diclina VS20]